MHPIGNWHAEHVYAHDGTGNGFQFACRPEEVKQAPAIGILEIWHSVVANNAIGTNSRGSNQIAIYGTGHHIDIWNVLVECYHQKPHKNSAGQDCYSVGGIWIEPEEPNHNMDTVYITPTNPNGYFKPVWWDSTKFGQGKVAIRDVDIDLDRPDRASIFLSACEEVILSNVRININGLGLTNGGAVEIDMSSHGTPGAAQAGNYDGPTYTPRPCGRVKITNCSGNAPVKLNGKTIGHISDEILIVDGKVVSVN
jgi:hypothetical protein